MTRMVNCIVLGEEAEGLDRPTYPGELGTRIFEQVSKQGWQQWLQKQTMLMNENRLSPIDPEHRAFLEKQMEEFFFGDGGEKIAGFVPPKS